MVCPSGDHVVENIFQHLSLSIRMSISDKSKVQGLLCPLFIVQDSPQLCKTKKGPPMDGTACGKEKWCVHLLQAGQSVPESFIHHMLVKVCQKPKCDTCVQTHLQLCLHVGVSTVTASRRARTLGGATD